MGDGLRPFLITDQVERHHAMAGKVMHAGLILLCEACPAAIGSAQTLGSTLARDAIEAGWMLVRQGGTVVLLCPACAAKAGLLSRGIEASPERPSLSVHGTEVVT
jgi:hypothetical protein